MIKLNKEAISDIGCNIATGIILEKLLEGNKKDIYLYINVFTLYRNFIGCLDGSSDDKIKYLKNKSILNKIYDLFVKDSLMFINHAIENGIKVTVYELEYKKLLKDFKYKTIDEFKGLKYFILTTQPYAANKLKQEVPGVYKRYGDILKHEKNMYITTHIGLDLLPLVKYNDVKIIESHTGEIKDNTKWYTKLRKYGKNDMSIIPFNTVTYYIYGDNDLVKPENPSIRKYVYGIAKRTNWYQGINSSGIISRIMFNDRPLASNLKRIVKIRFF